MPSYPRLQSSKRLQKLYFLDSNFKKEKKKKRKERIMHYPTNQNLDSGARLQNRKVLGTHSTQMM